MPSETSNEPDSYSVVISHAAMWAAINCLHACSYDEREPTMYREWYSDAHDELVALVGPA